MRSLRLVATNSGLGYNEYTVLLDVGNDEYLCVDLYQHKLDYFGGYEVGKVETEHIDELLSLYAQVKLPENYDIKKSEWYLSNPFAAQYFLDHHYQTDYEKLHNLFTEFGIQHDSRRVDGDDHYVDIQESFDETYVTMKFSYLDTFISCY